MVAFPTAMLLFLQTLTNAQPELFVPIGEGTSCEGRSGSLSEYGVSDKQIGIKYLVL